MILLAMLVIYQVKLLKGPNLLINTNVFFWGSFVLATNYMLEVNDYMIVNILLFVVMCI